MTTPRGVQLNIPYPPKSKPRPRVTKNGTFNPKAYEEWKSNVAEVVELTAKEKGLSGPLSLVLEMWKDHMVVLISEGATDRFGQSDIDNLAGGLMDALNQTTVIHDDRQFTQLMVVFKTEGGS